MLEYDHASYVMVFLKDLYDIGMMDIEEAKTVVSLFEKIPKLKEFEVKWNTEEAKKYFEIHRLSSLI